MVDNNTGVSADKRPTLPASLQYIARKLQGAKDFSPSKVSRIIREANVKAKDLEAWADYDHPTADSYGRTLVYDGGHFEIMVMSWRPGDFSAIHDHGHAQWGAVQIFGPAEHATFRVENGRLSTLARWRVTPGDIVGVSHALVHQMGNPTKDVSFLSLHIYGDLQDRKSITGDARIFDAEREEIQRVDGGVFFGLPAADIKKTEPGPKADFPTRLRHMVELIRRLRKMEDQGGNKSGKELEEVVRSAFSARHRPQLLEELQANTDTNDHQINSIYWRIINRELQEAASLQIELQDRQRSQDHFHKYAQLYDELIGKPCLNNFMSSYLAFFIKKYVPDFSKKQVISLGCGTGLVEKYMIDELGLPLAQLYGIDISQAMVSEAQKRIRAEAGDMLQLDASGNWDIAYSGLNVFQYIPPDQLKKAIENAAALLKPGAYFIGDFITPDHIRWYPNVVYSSDQKMISLRTPQLIETAGSMFQESEIINLDFSDGQLEVTYAGKHKRFLPPVHRIRTYFEKAFGGRVELFDAHSLEMIPEHADSCTSTRYVVVAQKRG